MTMAYPERIAGGLWGLLIGDAVGVPYEFYLPESLPPYAQLEMVPPSGFARAHATVPVGTWSDDGAQALALLASLLHQQQLDIDDFGRRLVSWYQVGYMAVDNHVFDVGIQTAHAIRRMMAGISAMQAGSSDDYANGNGSLMRVLPLALWHSGSDEALVHSAHLQSHVTHAHLRAKVCCALYCLWARQLLQGIDKNEAWTFAVHRLRHIYSGPDYKDSPALAELEFHVRPDEEPRGQGSGYVVDCLHSARLAMQQDNFEDVIKTAIALGRDTDTTACVAGGVAGIYFGVKSIPLGWMHRLREKETVAALLQGLQHKLLEKQ